MLAVLAAVVAIAATGAPAAGAAPLPGCQGLAFSDPTGDQQLDGVAGAQNMDIVGGFFTIDGDGNAVADIVVNDLSAKIPAGAPGVIWAMHFTLRDHAVVVYAVSDALGIHYGDQVDDQPPYPTGGNIVPGPDGVIQIDAVVGSLGVASGTTVSGSSAETDVARQTVADVNPLLGSTVIDRAPDVGTGGSYTFGGPCPAIEVLTHSASARRARRSGAVRIALRSNTAVTDVTVSLTRGAKTVATAAVGRLSGTATVHLQANRALAPGRYGIAVTATPETPGTTPVRVSGRLRVTR
jgi:hypothetical protein